MTTRRQFLVVGAFGAATSARVFAQIRPRIGILAGIPRNKSVATPLLLERLAELGYQEGKTMSIEYRHAVREDRYPALAQELLQRKCDLIFAIANVTMARTLRDARTSTPVVLLAVEYDPIESGIVASLARPGGNITGVFLPVTALIGKRVEVAQEILPTATRYL
jgi:putative ABC transport system substrate-binding protein